MPAALPAHCATSRWSVVTGPRRGRAAIDLCLRRRAYIQVSRRSWRAIGCADLPCREHRGHPRVPHRVPRRVQGLAASARTGNGSRTVHVSPCGGSSGVAARSPLSHLTSSAGRPIARRGPMFDLVESKLRWLRARRQRWCCACGAEPPWARRSSKWPPAMPNGFAAPGGSPDRYASSRPWRSSANQPRRHATPHRHG